MTRTTIARQLVFHIGGDDPITRRASRNFYRLNCQFISGNDRRAMYDLLHALMPVSAKSQTLAQDDALPMFRDDGALIGVAPSVVSRRSD